MISSNTQTVHTTIIIVAHAPLASAYLALIEHIYTLQDKFPKQVYAIDVPAGEARDVTEQAIKSLLFNQCYIDSMILKPTPCLILTDLAGATPHNCAINACNNNQANEQESMWYVATPISAPLLLRAINYRHLNPAALRNKLLYETV
jgi:mannose/fructose-specific phosphotransferase system component IIA